MAPPLRKQPGRSAPVQSTSGTPAQSARQIDALTDFQARRLQRRLDDLERTNPTDIPASSFAAGPSASSKIPTGPSIPGAPGQTAQAAAAVKKKQTPNVRKVLFARKTLKDWLEELPMNLPPPYSLAVAPPPSTPPRKICSSCGYIGAYRCVRCAEWSCSRECVGVHERDGGCGIGG